MQWSDLGADEGRPTDVPGAGMLFPIPVERMLFHGQDARATKQPVTYTAAVLTLLTKRYNLSA